MPSMLGCKQRGATYASLSCAPHPKPNPNPTLQMHIDYRQGRNSDWLRRLARGADGRRLPYVELVELALPAHLNLSSLHSAGSFSLGEQLSGRSRPHGRAAAGGSHWAQAHPHGGKSPGWQERLRRGQQVGGGQAQPQAAGWWRADQATTEDDDSMPVRAMSRAIYAFHSSMLGSAPSRQAPREVLL